MSKLNKNKLLNIIVREFETEHMRYYCEDMIEQIPDYIFQMPSSTSFKYHNATQCQPHGQLLHIVMFGTIMNYILGLKYVKERTTSEERDCLRCTAIFHDALKCGDTKHTVHEHPMLAAQWIRETTVEHDISDELKQRIADLCESHSGEWTSSVRSKFVLEEPKTDEQFLVHMCDYLASRKNLDMKYEKEYLDLIASMDTLPNIDEYKLTFGKYKGMTLTEINNRDKNYIQWAKENIRQEPVRSLLEKL